MIWKVTMSTPPTCRRVFGPSPGHGAASSQTWFHRTPPRWNHFGMKCSQRLNGFGIGCVS